MFQRMKAAGSVAAILAGLAVVLSSAGAAEAAPAPKKARIDVVGSTKFVAGHHVTDDQRFKQLNTRIRSGGTVTVVNRAKSPDPHTLSLVKRAQLPRSFECEACGPFFGAHEVNEETGTPGKPLVDVGAAGFDQAGDSIFFGPRERVSFKVTAPRGSRLHFLCAVHPWMQGSITVR